MIRSNDITTEDLTKFEHEFKKGVSFRKDKHDRYLTREDVCRFCGCVKTSTEFVKAGKFYDLPVYYERSGATFSQYNPPSCWGDTKP